MENVVKKELLDDRSLKNDLYNEDLRSFGFEERSISAPTLFATWFGMSVQLGIFMASAQLVRSFTVGQILLILFLGNLLCVAISVFAQDIGIKYGLPFAVSIRTSFGYIGGHFGGVLRMLPSIFFVGLNTWIGAAAMNEIFKLTIGFDNLILMMLVFAVVTVLLVFYGAKLIATINWIATPLLLIIGVYLLHTLLESNHSSLSEVMTLGGNGGFNPMLFIYGTLAIAGGWASVVLSINDITRECKTDEEEVKSWNKCNFRYAVAQLFGILPSCVLFGGIGAISMALTGNSNPVEIITITVGAQSIFTAIICQLFVVLAMISTTSGANLLGSAYVLCNLSPKRMTLRRAAVIVMIVSLVLKPWQLAGTMMPVLTMMGSALGPVTSIMIIDYYLIRKRRIDIDHINSSNGKYKYFMGINPAAFIAYGLGIVTSLFSISYMYAISMIVGGVAYYVLMKVWILKKYSESIEHA